LKKEEKKKNKNTKMERDQRRGIRIRKRFEEKKRIKEEE